MVKVGTKTPKITDEYCLNINGQSNIDEYLKEQIEMLKTSLIGFKNIIKQVAINQARPIEMIKEIESIKIKVNERKIPAMLIKNHGGSP